MNMYNTKYFDECQQYAFRQRNIQALSLKDTDLRVYERRVANPGSIFSALSKQGIVIPVVDAALFGGEPGEPVATLLVSANQVLGQVSLYVAAEQSVRSLPIPAFVEAWERTGGRCTTAFPPHAKTYAPKLLDLTHVELPAGYDELREAIAENAHDSWALERQSEGWTYGPKRNDAVLETPCMVPYAELPESEKQYDRIMAADTLKLLVALGYDIRRRDD